jgi:hypothetical protein
MRIGEKVLQYETLLKVADASPTLPKVFDIWLKQNLSKNQRDSFRDDVIELMRMNASHPEIIKHETVLKELNDLKEIFLRTSEYTKNILALQTSWEMLDQGFLVEDDGPVCSLSGTPTLLAFMDAMLSASEKIKIPGHNEGVISLNAGMGNWH